MSRSNIKEIIDNDLQQKYNFVIEFKGKQTTRKCCYIKLV